FAVVASRDARRIDQVGHGLTHGLDQVGEHSDATHGLAAITSIGKWHVLRSYRSPVTARTDIILCAARRKPRYPPVSPCRQKPRDRRPPPRSGRTSTRCDHSA